MSWADIDLSNPLVLFGVVCLVAAASGAAVKALGSEISVIATPARQAAVGVIGLILIVIPTLVKTDAKFRVEAVSASWSSTGVISCAVPQPYTGVISTGGTEEGSVQYRFIFSGTPAQIQTLTVPRAGDHAVEGVHVIQGLAGLPQSDIALQLEVLSPTRITSAPAILPIMLGRC